MALTHAPYLQIKDFESEDIIESLSESFYSEEVIIKNNAKVENNDSDAYSPAVELLLEGWGLEKYLDLFKSEDIELSTIIKLNREDLIALGITDAEDQNTILNYLKEFHTEKDANDYKPVFPDIVEDDLTMAKNVYSHLTKLNSHASYIHFLMGRRKMDDYFVSNHETALTIMKLVCGKAQMQSNRISDLLFDGDFKGHSLIASVLQVNGLKLAKSKKDKLIQSKMGKRLKKRKILIFTVVTAVGLLLAAVSVRRNSGGKFW